MKFTYDPKANAAYIFFRPIKIGSVAKTVPWEKDEGIIFDFDNNNNLIGIEILDYSDRVGHEKSNTDYLYEYSLPIPQDLRSKYC